MRFLLDLLLHRLMFAGTMFFAAGAAAIGDAGAGDAVIVDSGEGDPAGEANTADGSEAASGDDSASPDNAGDDGDDTAQPDGQIQAGDQIKAHIEALKKTNPALAKELKNLYFSQDALRKEFPGGLPELRQIKETVDSLGGKEGIDGLKAEQTEWHTLDDKFIAGDASVLDDFAKFNPESFAKIAPSVLDKLAQVDKAAYDYKLSGIFAATLDSWRFFDTLDRVAERIGSIVDDKGQPLCKREVELIGNLVKQYDGLKEISSKAPQPQKKDEKNTLDTERAQIAQQKAEVAAEYVGNATQFHAKERYDSVVPAEAKNQKLDLELMRTAGSYDRMMRQIDEEIAREVTKDTSFSQKLGASLASGRRDEAVKLSNAKFDAVVGQVVKRVVREWATLMNPKGVVTKSGVTGSKPTPAGVKKLSDAPDLAQVDQTAPDWRNQYMVGKAKLKTGQRVEW